VSPPIAAASLRPRVTVTALSEDILQVDVRASQASQAVQLANAISLDYIRYVSANHIDAETPSAGTARVLQSAAVVRASKFRVPLDGVIGCLVGLLAGCALALVRSKRDRRLHLRDEVAGAVGLPVVASIDAERRKSTKDWRRLLQSYQPSPVEAWSVRRVLDRALVLGDPRRGSEVVVMAFAEDGPALAAGVQFAKTATTLGLPVALAPAQHPALSGLRAACMVEGGSASPERLFTFQTQGLAAAAQDPPLTVSLVAVDSARPEPSVSGVKGYTLLAVSSGSATVENLARVALAAADARHPIEGILMVNADAGDRTTGSVLLDGADWHGLLLESSARHSSTSFSKGAQGERSS
jgi:hypothetical protein